MLKALCQLIADQWMYAMASTHGRASSGVKVNPDVEADCSVEVSSRYKSFDCAKEGLDARSTCSHVVARQEYQLVVLDHHVRIDGINGP